MTRRPIISAFLLGTALALGSHSALAFDEDRNGVISSDEAMTWSETNFAERFGDVDEVAIEDFEAEMGGYDAASIDEDGNGAITSEEWSTYTGNRYDAAGQDEMELTDFEEWTAQGMQ